MLVSIVEDGDLHVDPHLDRTFVRALRRSTRVVAKGVAQAEEPETEVMPWDAHKEHAENAKFFRERMEYVLGDTSGLKMQVGKHDAMNLVSLKSVYEEAREKCPRAADTIAWMLWHSILAADRLALLTNGADSS